ncbi:hypothetical protein Golob_017551, partial [Gossypium lobatum]|nr:hypothetical protein [Gossypium lobatum]
MVVATTCLLCGHDTESFDHIVRECLPAIELWMDLQVTTWEKSNRFASVAICLEVCCEHLCYHECYYAKVRHIHREGNSCMGHLANLAQNIKRGLVRLETSPMSIKPLLHNDACGEGTGFNLEFLSAQRKILRPALDKIRWKLQNWNLGTFHQTLLAKQAWSVVNKESSLPNQTVKYCRNSHPLLMQ